MKQPNRVLAVVVIVVAVAVLGGLASASSQNFNVLGNNAQPGMLMSLTANAGYVEPATDKNASSLLGVLTSDTQTFDRQAGQVAVQTDGAASALVSTLNGDVLVGDRIGISPVAGVGAKMKSSGWIVGVAQASLDSKTTGAVATTVSDSKNNKHTVYVAAIPLVVKVTYYSAPGAVTVKTSTVPTSLQSTVDTIAGKHVSVLGIVLSFMLISIGIIFAAQVVSSVIRGSFTAIGRQPLSKRVILRLVLQLLAMSGLILIAASVGAYVMLRLL